ncbi:MAG: NAD(P)H-hydrate dehydratase [Desulfuromonas sp.]|nr:NAD(P)H-hydrate dehydratase [Desulfuromonas sp.]
MKLLTADQMRQMDQRAIHDYGLAGIVLMENAGRGAAQVIAGRYADLFPGPVLILTGKGNNGGDGYVVARYLGNCGWDVTTVALAQREQIGGDAASNLEILLNSQSPVLFYDPSQTVDDTLNPYGDSVIIVDAIFGNGLTSAVRGHYLDAIHWINRHSVKVGAKVGAKVAAIDMPSGVEATSGQVLGEVVEADCSLSFAFAKIGQVSYPAQRYGGELSVIDLGMPRPLTEVVTEQLALVDSGLAQRLLPRRPDDGHKGMFGHVLLVAGSQGKSGAARMCAEAALRSGSGLMTVAVPATVQPQIAAGAPEVMTVALTENEGALCRDSFVEIKSLWHGMAVVAVGPGLGTQTETQELVRQIVQDCPCPLVLDADALNALAETPELLRRRTAATVLTPHPGEMARLTGLSVEAVQSNRLEVARQFADDYQVCLLLKGARTVIADETGRLWVNSTGNSGMASAGMGDLLTGIIAAYVAQKQDVFSAAALGAYLHGAAADLCAEKLGGVGFLATDVSLALPVVRQHLKEGIYA